MKGRFEKLVYMEGGDLEICQSVTWDKGEDLVSLLYGERWNILRGIWRIEAGVTWETMVGKSCGSKVF